jgi:1,2-dihydroxy-3-keto-5-methylthiopentene dioxygenase
MARIVIPDEIRLIDQPDALSAYLESIGVHYERWDVESRVDPDASPDEILAAYAHEIDAVKERGGYVTADVISVTTETPNLEAMLDSFRKEHTHTEDEVCFFLKGGGVFYFHPTDGPVIRLEVEAGDFIRVPAGVRHWFDLSAERTLRAIRFFQDTSGWTPHYVEHGVHDHYQPVRVSPGDLPTERVAYDWVMQP